MPAARIDYAQVLRVVAEALAPLEGVGISVVHMGEQPPEGAVWLLDVTGLEIEPLVRIAGPSEPDRSHFRMTLVLAQAESEARTSGVYEIATAASRVMAALDEHAAALSGHTVHLRRPAASLSQSIDEQNRPLLSAVFTVAGEAKRETGDTIVPLGP